MKRQRIATEEFYTQATHNDMSVSVLLILMVTVMGCVRKTECSGSDKPQRAHLTLQYGQRHETIILNENGRTSAGGGVTDVDGELLSLRF